MDNMGRRWIKFQVLHRAFIMNRHNLDRTKFIVECSGVCNYPASKIATSTSDILFENLSAFMAKYNPRPNDAYLYSLLSHRKFLGVNPFLIIYSGSDIVRRARRRTNQCSNHAQNQCCRERLYVNFRELGWNDWIIAPHGYYANYCRGNCKVYPLNGKTKSNHGHILSEYRKHGPSEERIQSCCTPIKFSSISVIYYEENKKIVKRDIPSMAVDDCGCP